MLNNSEIRSRLACHNMSVVIMRIRFYESPIINFDKTTLNLMKLYQYCFNIMSIGKNYLVFQAKNCMVVF